MATAARHNAAVLQTAGTHRERASEIDSGQPLSLSDEDLRRLGQKWYAELAEVHASEQTAFDDWLRGHIKWNWHDYDRIRGADSPRDDLDLLDPRARFYVGMMRRNTK